MITEACQIKPIFKKDRNMAVKRRVNNLKKKSKCN